MKYIIEIPDDVQYVLFNGQTDNKCYTAVRPVAELEVLNSDYINEHYGQMQDEAYKRGINDGSLDVKLRVEGAYQRGLDDAQPKSGKWIDAVIPNDNGGLLVQVCDQCNTFFPLAYTGGGHHFCPNCGADMKEVTE